MKASVTWWDLSESDQTIESLREYLRDEGVKPWASVRGLRMKFWISDPAGNRWGAVMLWETDDIGDQPLPPHRALDLIGYAPAERVRFDVEATVEGVFSDPRLADRGLAFASVEPPAWPVLPEFDTPPGDPIGMLRGWFGDAVSQGFAEPGVVALATVDAEGRPSNRMVQTIEITDRGLVFTSHDGSQKGRDIAATGRASGVLYWRESKQQIVLTGRVERLPAAESDRLWAARPASTHPMSVASRQSEPLADEEALRAEALRLGVGGTPLPRPETWAGYVLLPETLEFWHGSPDRLHRRLRYDRAGDDWTTLRLQP